MVYQWLFGIDRTESIAINERGLILGIRDEDLTSFTFRSWLPRIQILFPLN